MPDTYGNVSHQIWRLVGGDTDLRFEINGDIRWTNALKGSKNADVCSGDVTISLRSMGRASGVFTAFFAANEHRDSRMAAFYAAAQAKVRYQLTQPGGVVRNVRFDPTVPLEQNWHSSGARVITFGMQEVA